MMGSLTRLPSVALVLLASAGARAEAPAPLRQAQVIALPGVEKRIDHLAVDPAGKRLFVSALGNGSLEVIDLEAGKRVRTQTGIGRERVSVSTVAVASCNTSVPVVSEVPGAIPAAAML